MTALLKTLHRAVSAPLVAKTMQTPAPGVKVSILTDCVLSCRRSLHGLSSGCRSLCNTRIRALVGLIDVYCLEHVFWCGIRLCAAGGD